MASSPEQPRILLVRPWTEPLAPLRAALRQADLDARIVRVDIEPALNAALARGSTFDVIVLDPATRGITRELVDARLREHRHAIPIVVVGRLELLAAEIRRALAGRRN